VYFSILKVGRKITARSQMNNETDEAAAGKGKGKGRRGKRKRTKSDDENESEGMQRPLT
jgi:hypothetical protein